LEPVEHFDRIYTALANSKVYREAVRASLADLPPWLVPFSVLNTHDLDRFAEELHVGPDDTFVDLGCGAGGPGLWVAGRTGASVVGVDFSAAALRSATKLARERGMEERARFVQAEATATGLPDGTFAGVMSIDAIMFADPDAVIAEIARLLRKGGIAAVRATESLIDPSLETLVSDYRPYFQAAGLTVTALEKVATHPERSLRFFRAVLARSAALKLEIGADADLLIEEASGAVARANEVSRVRTRFIVAQKRR
jgi:cyclopropane fatty-acyl-phospholipid synthase-like methyltransferase